MRTFRENEPLLQAITAPVLNEMARAVNRVGELDRVTLGGFGSEIVATIVRVSSATAIPAFSPVQFVPTGSTAADEAFSAAEAVKPVPAVVAWAPGDEDRTWALMLEPVSAGGVARAIIAGVVMCKVKITAGHEHVAPAVGKLVSTPDVTSAKIISASSEADESGLVWATLLLGAASLGGWPQWGCSIVSGEESFSLRVRSGSLAWGGGHYAVWPSGNAVGRDLFEDIELAVPVGETQFVVWSTTAPPVPLRYCPKKPSTNATCAECDACGTVGAAGDPDNFTPDTGSVSIVATPERADGWTDFRVLATVECTAEASTASSRSRLPRSQSTRLCERKAARKILLRRKSKILPAGIQGTLLAAAATQSIQTTTTKTARPKAKTATGIIQATPKARTA